MTEAHKTNLFMKWSRARFNETFAFEAKICKKSSLPFIAVKPHQESALKVVKDSCFNHKIADTSLSPLPFDGFQMVKQPAYVVIFWCNVSRETLLTMIDIDTWLRIKQDPTNKRKSITRAQAIDLAVVVDKL